MDNFNFEDIYKQVSWELCTEAASNAITSFEIFVYEDIDEPRTVKRARSVETAAEQLMGMPKGGIRIHGTWKAAGKHGELDVVYVKRFSPTATPTYMVRLINELVRLQIAKQLYIQGNPDVELIDDQE